MTERCQKKFREFFRNQNNIIFAAFLAGSLVVLCYYRFHFVTVAFSYVLGCMACYYTLEWSVFQEYMTRLKCHFSSKLLWKEPKVDPVNGCETCGSKECHRHDTSITAEPWVGLQIHKQLDQAIEDFYTTILDHFITTWYSKITLQPFFVDELKQQLRYASASLLRRAIKINYARFIMERLVPCALRHYTTWAGDSHHTPIPHPAAANRAAEIAYLRALTTALMPYLLRKNELESPVFKVLIREIFAGWVLLSLTDVLADPYILNTLIILATDNEKMAILPTTPNYRVEFLETFVRQTESVYTSRGKLLKVDLDFVITDQEHFYAFMQYMKTTSHIHLLQFYKDIKTFQTKILNPDLSPYEVILLHREACDMHARYFDTDNVSESLQPFAEELKELLKSDPADVKRLQTSRALYQAARQSHSELEKIMLPKFLHSEEFYNIFIGSRLPTGYHKHMTRKPPEKPPPKLSKLKALRSQAIDGQTLETLADDGDVADNLDILKYLDSIISDDNVQEHDLTTFKVVLTNVETRLQAPPRRGTVRVFTLTVHRSEATGARLWTLERSEHDFHLLRSKLHEFHGDRLLHDLPLPSRRDNSPMETLRYKYEDFLQRLLQKSLLQTSELLYLFLTVDGDFSMVVQASTLNAANTDLANIYQSVTHKLRKEKGQHLESFLINLLVSSDIDRYQALKQGTTHVEEAVEVNEDVELDILQERKRNVRNIHNTVFGNNFGADPIVQCVEGSEQNVVAGFSQCCMFLLIKVFRVRAVISGVIGSVISMVRDVIDDLFNAYLNRQLYELLCERRLAHLIRLGHSILFGKKSTPRFDAVIQRERARANLMGCIPPIATQVAGPGLPIAVHTAFELIQQPPLNKQLVYNLLDLCILELFPELSATKNP